MRHDGAAHDWPSLLSIRGVVLYALKVLALQGFSPVAQSPWYTRTLKARGTPGRPICQVFQHVIYPTFLCPLYDRYAVIDLVIVRGRCYAHAMMICAFCDYGVYGLVCPMCHDYKGMMTLAEWEAYTGETFDSPLSDPTAKV